MFLRECLSDSASRVVATGMSARTTEKCAVSPASHAPRQLFLVFGFSVCITTRFCTRLILN